MLAPMRGGGGAFHTTKGDCHIMKDMGILYLYVHLVLTDKLTPGLAGVGGGVRTNIHYLNTNKHTDIATYRLN